MKTKFITALLLLVLMPCESSLLESNNDCYTRKTTNGKCCVFPFVYNGRKYYDCIALKYGRQWCSLTRNYDNDRKFGICDETIPIFDKILNINDNDKIANAEIGGGVELFQGDIEMTPELKVDLIRKGIISGPRRQARAVTRNRGRRWFGTNGRPEIPYLIERSNYHARGVIEQAMRHWESKVPCLRFVRRTSQRNYLSFFAGRGCYSAVGRRGNGAQKISIGRGCERMGVVAHEIGHALGFWHEQSRPDRDDYVIIHWANIRSGTEHNFRKYSTGMINSLSVPYDYVSLMHYGPKAFSRNGRNTITRKRGGATLGQRYGLSPRDVQQAKLFYCGNAPKPIDPPTRSPPGCRYTDRYRSCSNWKKRGYCTNFFVKNFMMRNCQKSCQCSAQETCDDKRTASQCSFWKNYGYCERYASVRVLYCRKTCGRC